MKYKRPITTFIVLAVALSLIGCGVPKQEHEKIVKELEKANEQKAALNDQLDTVTKEKESLSRQVADLQNQIGTLRKEKEELKAKFTPKKPASRSTTQKK